MRRFSRSLWCWASLWPAKGVANWLKLSTFKVEAGGICKGMSEVLLWCTLSLIAGGFEDKFDGF